jgi:hypothetical protein
MILTEPYLPKEKLGLCCLYRAVILFWCCVADVDWMMSGGFGVVGLLWLAPNEREMIDRSNARTRETIQVLSVVERVSVRRSSCREWVSCWLKSWESWVVRCALCFVLFYYDHRELTRTKDGRSIPHRSMNIFNRIESNPTTLAAAMN